MDHTLNISELNGKYLVKYIPFLKDFGELVYSFMTNSLECLKDEVSRRIRQIRETRNYDDSLGDQINISLTGFNEEKDIVQVLRQVLEERVENI